MKCPNCNKDDDKVLESRPSDEGESIRRRRECLSCGHRFTSYERIENKILTVVKRDGRHEEFIRDKVLTGIVRACEKRPISLDTIEEIVNAAETLAEKSQKEIKTKKIGELIMSKLQKIDEIAYIRFASVYRQFKDVKEFVEVIEEVQT
jgi:transcriptional repressor NrdR